MGESVAFPYLACLILRTASGCDIVAVKFSGACPGFPDFKTSLTKFFLEFGKVKALHLLQYAVHGFLDFRFVDFANVLRLYKVPFLGYGIGGFRCLFPYPVVPVEFPGKGYPVCQYMQVRLFLLALRPTVFDDEIEIGEINKWAGHMGSRVIFEREVELPLQRGYPGVPPFNHPYTQGSQILFDDELPGAQIRMMSSDPHPPMGGGGGGLEPVLLLLKDLEIPKFSGHPEKFLEWRVQIRRFLEIASMEKGNLPEAIKMELLARALDTKNRNILVAHQEKGKSFEEFLKVLDGVYMGDVQEFHRRKFMALEFPHPQKMTREEIREFAASYECLRNRVGDVAEEEEYCHLMSKLNF